MALRLLFESAPKHVLNKILHHVEVFFCCSYLYGDGEGIQNQHFSVSSCCLLGVYIGLNSSML